MSAPSDLVELVTLDPTIRLDIRYATDHNFLGDAGLHAGARVPAAAGRRGAGARAPGARDAGLRPADPRRLPAVVRDEDLLGRHAARQARLRRRSRRRARATTAAAPSTSRCTTSRPARRSRCRACTTRCRERAYRDYAGGTARQRELRDLLRRAMEAEGFTVYERVVALRLPRLAVVRRAERAFEDLAR